MGSEPWGSGRFGPTSLALHASHYLRFWPRAQLAAPFAPSPLPSLGMPETMQEIIDKTETNGWTKCEIYYLWPTCSSSWGDGYAAVTAEATAGLTLFSCCNWLLQTWTSPDPSLSTRTPLAHEPSMQNGSSARSVSCLEKEEKVEETGSIWWTFAWSVQRGLIP